MKLSVIVPVYNEEKHLSEVIDYLYKAPCPIEREWIFVNDCSKDQSGKILRELQPKYGYILIEHDSNLGKGTAVICGIKAATGDLIIIQDADYEYDPNDVPALLEPIVQNRADVVYGSRFKKNVFQVHRTYHYFVNRLLTILSNMLSGIYLTDMETCYKVFKSDLLKSMNLTSRRFGIEIELTAFVAKTSARIFELPIAYYPRTRLQGKKINWKDGIAALIHLVKFNMFVDRDVAFTNLADRYNPLKKKTQKDYARYPL